MKDAVRLGNGFETDHLPSVDIQEILKMGGKVISLYEDIIFRESFKVKPIQDVTE